MLYCKPFLYPDTLTVKTNWRVTVPRQSIRQLCYVAQSAEAAECTVCAFCSLS